MIRLKYPLLMVLVLWAIASSDVRSQNVDQGEWLPTFGMPGVDAVVNAIAIDGNDTYAGGKFRIAGTVVANGIARWDGDRWWPLGDAPAVGVDGTVNAIAVIGDNVFVGGSFSYAGGVEARNIAVWNRMTGTWSGVGGGVGGGLFPFVAAFAVQGNDLYVGGRFSETGELLGFNIARWDGEQWRRLGSGLNGDVLALRAADDQLYVGGRFTTAGGNSASCVASYSIPDVTWAPLGAGVSGGDSPQVSALDFFGGNLYVGGGFVTAGSVATPNVARWESGAKKWSGIGSGLSRRILAIVADTDQLIALGDIGAVLGDTGWVPYPSGDFRLPGGTPRIYAAVKAPGGGIYIGGEFASIGTDIWYPNGEMKPSAIAFNIVCLKGGVPFALGSTIGGTVRALAFSGGSLYAAGPFTRAGPVAAGGVARWEAGTGRWSSLDSRAYTQASNVHVLSHGTYVLNGTSLIRHDVAGDSFTVAVPGNGDPFSRYAASGDDGHETIYIVRGDSLISWNGTELIGLAPGHNSGALALAVHGSEVFVGGYFDSVQSRYLKSIARWSAVTGEWSDVGGGIAGQQYPKVFAVAVDSSGRIYAGGTFKQAGETSVRNIAMYDPESDSWSDMGGGANDSVLALLVHGNDVYAAGRFTQIGGVDASSIARWDGTAWHALGSGIQLDVRTDLIFSLTMSPDGDLFVGGQFLRAGLNPSYSLAHWRPGKSTAVPDRPNLSPTEVRSIAVQVRPNPISQDVTFEYDLTCAGETRVKVFTESGELRLSIPPVDLPIGRHSSHLDLGHLPNGVYYVHVECGGCVGVARVEVVR